MTPSLAVRLAPAAAFAAIAAAQVPPHAVTVNPSKPLWELRLSKHGESVHAIGWQPAQGARPIVYGHSRDGGRTWPQRETVVGSSRGPGQLVADGDDVYLGTDGGIYAPYVTASHDGGVTWQAPVLVHNQNINASEPWLHAADGAVTAIWLNRAATVELRTARSTDGGATFGPMTRIDAGAPEKTPLQQQQDAGFSVLADGDVVHVIWTRWIGTPSTTLVNYTLHQRSLDGGATWLPTPNVIGTHGEHFLQQAPLQPAAIGDGVVYATTDLTLWRSIDQGTSWQVAPGHGLQASVQRIFDIAADGADVVVVGAVNVSLGGLLTINASGDRGTTWLPTPTPMALASLAQIVPFVQQGTIWLGVTYQSGSLVPRTGQSQDLAATWRLVQGTGAVAAADDDGAVALAPAPGQVLAQSAWVMEGHTTLGQGSPGTGGGVPLLRGRGIAGLGLSFSLTIADAAPNSLVAVFPSFDATTAVPFGPATSYLTNPLPALVGTSSAAGEASFAIGVPANPALAGVRLASQALVFDAGVAAGFAATRAVETWIR